MSEVRRLSQRVGRLEDGRFYDSSGNKRRELDDDIRWRVGRVEERLRAGDLERERERLRGVGGIAGEWNVHEHAHRTRGVDMGGVRMGRFVFN